MSESNVISKEDLDHTKAFEEKASKHKTPQRLPKPSIFIQPFDHTFDKEKIKKESKFQPGGFGEASMSFFDQVIDQLNHIESVLKQLRDSNESNNDQLSTNLEMLQFEKNKLKAEIGSRQEVLIQENFDAASVWESVSLISSFLDEKIHSDWNQAESASSRTFETWARFEIEKAKCVHRELNLLRKENKSMKDEMKDVRSKLHKMEENLSQNQNLKESSASKILLHTANPQTL